MDKPIKASEIKTPDSVPQADPDDLARQVAESRLVRRDALRKMGATGPSSGDLAIKLEDGLKNRADAVMREFRARNKR